MSDDRRFSESEIREVFERAAAEQERAARHHADDGLTLAEMQEVAASAGIAPEFVASAARSVALGEPEQGRQSVAFVPRGVFRTELLPGPPTDALWDSVLADARRTFSAQGKVSEGGRVREWRNGNLRVTLEPAGDGTRLHLRTRRDEIPQLTLIAAVVVVFGLGAAFVGSLDAGANGGGAGEALLAALVGMLAVAGVWSGQRRWADTRERQFEEVARRAAAAAVETSETTAAAVPDAVAPGRIDASALDLDVPASEPPRSDRQRTRG